MLFRKWRERDAAKLRKLEKRFEELECKFSSLKLHYGDLRSDYRRLEKRVGEKEITHVQKVNVTLHRPFDYDGWLP